MRIHEVFTLSLSKGKMQTKCADVLNSLYLTFKNNYYLTLPHAVVCNESLLSQGAYYCRLWVDGVQTVMLMRVVR
jgi:hypothetical protein